MSSIADYELLQQLRPGNHGTYHLAVPPERLGLSTDTVVVKILDRHATDNEFKRMAAELRTMNGIEHPHLVRLLDAGHDNGRLFYSSEFYADGSLSLGPPEDLAAVVVAIADAAEAAHALHEIGVVHRDIKPANILLHEGRGLLADLGVANYIDSDFTTTGNSVVGSIAYADPSLLDGSPPGRASDIFSLGATLHACLTGASVLGEIPDVHLAAAIRHAAKAIPQVAASCPQPYADLIDSCVNRDRSQRPPTAMAVAEKLRNTL